MLSTWPSEQLLLRRMQFYKESWLKNFTIKHSRVRANNTCTDKYIDIKDISATRIKTTNERRFVSLLQLDSLCYRGLSGPIKAWHDLSAYLYPTLSLPANGNIDLHLLERDLHRHYGFPQCRITEARVLWESRATKTIRVFTSSVNIFLSSINVVFDILIKVVIFWKNYTCGI